MKKVLVSFLLLGGGLFASPVQVSYVNPGTPAVVSNGVYIGPYTLNIGGKNVAAMCMDDFIETSGSWSANITSAAGPDFSNTYLGNSGLTVNGQNYSSADIYKAEAYLFSLITQPGADRVNIQEAAWAIMDQNTFQNVLNTNNTNVENYMVDAANNLSSFNDSGYSIVSEAGPHCEQEFMVASAPEPATLALFGGGFLMAGAARLFTRRKRQS